jgi:hypothetical protein
LAYSSWDTIGFISPLPFPSCPECTVWLFITGVTGAGFLFIPNALFETIGAGPEAILFETVEGLTAEVFSTEADVDNELGFAGRGGALAATMGDGVGTGSFSILIWLTGNIFDEDTTGGRDEGDPAVVVGEDEAFTTFDVFRFLSWVCLSSAIQGSNFFGFGADAPLAFDGVDNPELLFSWDASNIEAEAVLFPVELTGVLWFTGVSIESFEFECVDPLVNPISCE